MKKRINFSTTLYYCHLIFCCLYCYCYIFFQGRWPEIGFVLFRVGGMKSVDVRHSCDLLTPHDDGQKRRYKPRFYIPRLLHGWPDLGFLLLLLFSCDTWRGGCTGHLSSSDIMSSCALSASIEPVMLHLYSHHIEMSQTITRAWLDSFGHESCHLSFNVYKSIMHSKVTDMMWPFSHH